MRATRLLRYYILRIKRYKGSPHSIAGGIAVGTFIGLTPTMPFHTALIICTCIVTRTSIVIAIAISWFICNPLTYLPIYYFAAQVGNRITPYSLQISKFEELIEKFNQETDFTEILSILLEAGYEAMIVMFIGGFAIAIPVGIITYYFSLLIIVNMRKAKTTKHILK